MVTPAFVPTSVTRANRAIDCASDKRRILACGRYGDVVQRHAELGLHHANENPPGVVRFACETGRAAAEREPLCRSVFRRVFANASEDVDALGFGGLQPAGCGGRVVRGVIEKFSSIATARSGGERQVP